MLELSGVLDGCSISARSAASLAFSAAFSASRRPTRAFKVAFSASSTSTRAASSAIRDSSAAGSVLVSDEERAAISAGNAMRRLPHKPSSAATKIGNVIAGTPSRPSRRPISPPSRVSNYVYIYTIYVEPRQALIKDSFDGFRGKVELTIGDSKEHTRDAEAIEERLRQ